MQPILDVPRVARQLLDEYARYNRVPGARAYYRHKERLIRRSLADTELLERFRTGELLPANFGVGIDERCVEYPWIVANLPTTTQRVLDAGSTLNHSFILQNPIFGNKKLDILTLAPERNCFWRRGISYIYSDLRDIPTKDDQYDSIICLSTLEHVGFDNFLFTGDDGYKENAPNDFILVMSELQRVLKCGGSLYLSVPFGRYRNFVMFQQFDRDLLSRAMEVFGGITRVTERFYRYTAQGWQVSTAADCADCEYVDWFTKPPALRPLKFPTQPDGATAARAVACVQIVKH